jgi:ferredoxin
MRKRRAQALARLAAAGGHTLSAAAFPLLRAHETCAHEGVCAAACPSGALTLVDCDGDQVGLDFDPTACLGCGLCAELCPHGALSVAQAGPAGALADGPVALTRHDLRQCNDCGVTFVAPTDAAACPRCRMARAQARDLFGSLRRGRTRSAAPVSPDPQRRSA